MLSEEQLNANAFYIRFLNYCHMGNLDKVRELISEYEFDVNVKDSDKNTGLLFACSRNFTDLAILLIENGANVNVQNKDLMTCLHYSITYRNILLTEKLLEKEAKLELVKSIDNLFNSYKANHDNDQKFTAQLIKKYLSTNSQSYSIF